MYFALGPQENLETLISLVAPHTEGSETRSIAALRTAYLDFLRARQPEVPYIGGSSVQIVADIEEIKILARIFGLDETPVGKASGFEAQRDPDQALPQWKRALIEGAVSDTRAFDAPLGALLNLVVDSVFTTANSLAAGSMTTGRALGVVWIDPLKDWAVFDCVEGLLHEMTHTLLMLDELRFVHYPDYPALKDAKNLAKSAIRSEARPLNAVVHSYVVAVELLAARQRYAPDGFTPRLHAETPQLREKTSEARESIRSLPNLPELITPRLGEILERVDWLMVNPLAVEAA